MILISILLKRELMNNKEKIAFLSSYNLYGRNIIYQHLKLVFVMLNYRSEFNTRTHKFS